jgi:uncharacterized membrane protein
VGRIIRVFLSGALALLPIVVTILVTLWLGSIVATYAGPGSFLGNLITSVGLNISGSSHVAYFIGLGIILVLIFLLGLAVESGLRNWISNSFDWFMMRIPLVSNVYDISKRFVAIMDRSGEEDSLKSMSPVWCFFGGEGSAGVLALMPSHEPVSIGETSYVPVLVPFAPVPFGGALIYVPQDWVRPAEGGVEKLVNVYVSMGVTPPQGIPPGGVPAGIFTKGAISAGGIPASGSAVVSEAADVESDTGIPESAPVTTKKPAPRKRARKGAAKTEPSGGG